MTNNPDDFQRENKIDGQRLKEMKSFKNHEAVNSYEGSKPATLSKIVQTTAIFLQTETYMER